MATTGIWNKHLISMHSAVETSRVLLLIERQACEAKEEGKQGSSYTCTADGQLQCFTGWTGDLCNVPICKKGEQKNDNYHQSRFTNCRQICVAIGCDPLNGYCRLPGECRCRIGTYMLIWRSKFRHILIYKSQNRVFWRIMLRLRSITRLRPRNMQ